ncbi:MAG TPA: hypothetical protein VMG10_28025 [Gemmataceae bacterium]|nr:hypothetical protein [Gemmataceae bacterium]
MSEYQYIGFRAAEKPVRDKDLREALAGTKQFGLAEQQARKLKKANPTLNLLTAELRRAGFEAK